MPPPEPDPLPNLDAASARRARPATHRSTYRPWAELLKRAFSVDVEHCKRCGGRMSLRALVQAPKSIARYLRGSPTLRDEPLNPPPLAPARGPPYWKSRVLRRKSHAQDDDLFDRLDA